MTVWTLGPAGTFSSEAAQEIFPDIPIEYAANFDQLFCVLESSDDSIAVMPIENSLHGSVHEVIDLLYDRSVSLWQAHDLRIRHAICAQATDGIEHVASHPQALAQCRQYLLEHYADAEYFPVSSTMSAIDLALKDRTTAAIAREDVMRQLGLTVLDTNIEGDNNTTRFGIFARHDPYPDSQRTHISIALHPYEDRPGVLHGLITPFKKHNISMTKIESRPTGKKIGDYIFFIDFEGVQDDAHVQQVFEELQPMTEIVMLGMYSVNPCL